MKKSPHPRSFKNFIWRHLQLFLQKLAIAYTHFFRNELLNHAAASALFFMLSIVPLFLLILYAFDQYLTAYPAVSDHFFNFLKTINEGFDKDFMVRIGMLKPRTRVVGIFGLVSLIWCGRWVILAIHRGLVIIFPAEKTRTTLGMNALSIVILFLLITASILGTLVSVGEGVFHGMVTVHPVIRETLTALLPLVQRYLPLAVTVVVIFLTYRLVPPGRPSTLSSLVGALLCGLLLRLLQNIFFKFFSVAQYNVLYGVLGSLILMVFWVYFSFIVFYFFAEFVFVSDKIETLVLERMYIDYAKEKKKKFNAGKFLFRYPRVILSRYLRICRSGEVLFKQGDSGTEIYFVVNGRVGVYQQMGDKRKRIAIIHQGEVFGEMAYLLEETRTATAIAEERCLLIAITPDLFEDLVQSNQAISRDVIQLLTHRLRKTHQHPLP